MRRFFSETYLVGTMGMGWWGRCHGIYSILACLYITSAYISSSSYFRQHGYAVALRFDTDVGHESHKRHSQERRSDIVRNHIPFAIIRPPPSPMQPHT